MDAPSPPYIEAKYHGNTWYDPEYVAIHSAVMSLYPGAARDLALYFQHPSYVSSCHYTIDSSSYHKALYQCVYDNYRAWHDGYNMGFGLEMCEYPSKTPGRWEHPHHVQLLHNTARLTRNLCIVYDIPMTLLNASELEAGKRGIVSHDTVSESDLSTTHHWDPGAFPWQLFMRLVRGEEEIMATAEEIWEYPIKSDTPDNPTWHASSFLKNIEMDTDVTQDMLRGVAATVANLAHKYDARVDVDEEAIAKSILERRSAQQLADLLSQSISENTARMTVDLLQSRLDSDHA